jgi:UDP-2,3-diacylglucosamine hydrolase
MGDLFEVWYENHWGAHPPYSKLFSLLGSLRKKLRSTHLIIGNREVLAGPVLEQKSGLTLHWGPLLLSAPSGNLLLMHGDELLPQDRSYQNFRQILRSPFTKFIIRLLPGPIIKALCGSARNRSRSKTPTQITHLPTVSAIWHHVKHIKPWSHHLLAGHFHKPISCEEKAGDQQLQISILSETTHRLRATGTWTNGRLKFDHQQT